MTAEEIKALPIGTPVVVHWLIHQWGPRNNRRWGTRREYNRAAKDMPGCNPDLPQEGYLIGYRNLVGFDGKFRIAAQVKLAPWRMEIFAWPEDVQQTGRVTVEHINSERAVS